MKKLLTILFLFCVCFCSCGDSPSNSEAVSSEAPPTAYEMMHTIFEGKPEIDAISKLMEPVMQQYETAISEENEQKFASALVSMKQKSAIGVTEMQILKYMYQHPNIATTLPAAVGTAAYILEGVK